MGEASISNVSFLYERFRFLGSLFGPHLHHSKVELSDVNPNAPERSRWATPHDWDIWRDRIQELYKSHKLEDVINIMEREAGFKAT